jgi:soluble lytic murein transglycosylase-like protein
MRRSARLSVRVTVALCGFLILSACSTFRLHRPFGPDERAKAVRVHSILNARGGSIDPRARIAIADVLMAAHREHGIDPLLGLALIETESGFRPDAVSRVGALGLLQVHPFVGRAVAAQIGVPWADRNTLLDPVSNVRIGLAYLAEMKERFGRLDLALTAYNLGPNRLDQMLARGQKPQFAFSKTVLAKRARLQRIQSEAIEVAGL